jgi:hypothetical protein
MHVTGGVESDSLSVRAREPETLQREKGLIPTRKADDDGIDLQCLHETEKTGGQWCCPR